MKRSLWLVCLVAALGSLIVGCKGPFVDTYPMPADRGLGTFGELDQPDSFLIAER